MTKANRILLIAACGAFWFAAACGGSSKPPQSITTSGPNVQPITVNAGPDNSYANGAFTSVTVCAPGTSTCQTIGGILVDTGSFGLRILSSALSISLPQQNATDGNPVAECFPFVSGFTWGPVQTADIQIASEKASSTAVQVINGSSFAIPSECSDQGINQGSDFITNGILGVGNFAQDCGPACVTTGPSNPNLYYECPSSGCVVTGESLANQVTNPVALFATDNNGVIIELPAAPNPEASLSGSLVFGIGTQSNNGLGSATIYAVDDNDDFITSYNGTSYSGSFLDSGSNGIYFLTSSITGFPDCNGFYCPSSTQNLSATTEGANGQGSATINFSVANADNLPNEPVLEQLAGPNPLSGFDWGLPFFYGRNVFTAIAGASTPAGPGPYWAY
jgi:hypothetical protein